MSLNFFVFAFSCFLIVMNGVRSVSIVQPPYECDRSSFRSHLAAEGALGQTALFPWMGILKVYLYDMGSVTVAVTGIIIIKDHFAIAKADDIAKIPKHIFVKNSEAMFVWKEGKLQYYSLRRYIIHPEYPAVNTLALLDLHPGTMNQYPILPICQPQFQFSPANELYTVGFTDENGPLEKFLHKVQFVDQKSCQNFYALAGLIDEKVVEENSKCASSKNLKEPCVWETGTALVSNVTGKWALIGLGVRGPGCAAPAHFISLATYWPWILSHTDRNKKHRHNTFEQGLKEYRRRYGDGEYYRSGFRPDTLMHVQPADFEDTTPETQDIPLHEFLRNRPPENMTKDERLSHFYGKVVDNNMFLIDRVNSSLILIRPATVAGRGRWGNCSDPTLKLVYKDHVDVTMKEDSYWSSIQYQISLYDLWFKNYTCVMIKVKTLKPVLSYLQYTVGMHDSSDLFGGDETPDSILKHYPTTDPFDKEKKPKLDKSFLTQNVDDDSVRGLTLYLKVLFVRESKLEITIFGQPHQYPPENPGNATTPKP